MPISNRVKKLIDRVNGHDGEEGADGIVDFWGLFLRAGRLVRDTDFISDLTALVERGEAARQARGRVASSVSRSFDLPNLLNDDWRTELCAWMQNIYDSLHELEGSPKVKVPEVPNFTVAQRQLIVKFNLGLFFIPAWGEKQFPRSFVKFNWTRLHYFKIERFPLKGLWIAFEMVKKPNRLVGAYPDDVLMEAISVCSRFDHPHSGKSDGYTLVEDILPKAVAIFASLGGTTCVQTAEVFNFMGNLFNWLNVRAIRHFPGFGNAFSVEWCANFFGSNHALIVGNSKGGWCANAINSEGYRRQYSNLGFRFMIEFENTATKVVV